MFNAFIFNIVVYIMDIIAFQKWQINDNFKLRIFQLLKESLNAKFSYDFYYSVFTLKARDI